MSLKNANRDRRVDRRICIPLHAARNRITLRSVIHRLFFPDCTTLTAVTRVTSALCAEGHLNRYPLIGKRVYFTPGPRAARCLNLHYSYARKLPKQRLVQELGALAYNCLGEQLHKRLLPAELKKQHPWIPQRHLYYRPFHMHKDGNHCRLATIHVELSSSPRDAVIKHTKLLRAYRAIAGFRHLLERDGFLCVVIVATPEARDAFVDEILNCPLYSLCHVMAYPDLQNFV